MIHIQLGDEESLILIDKDGKMKAIIPKCEDNEQLCVSARVAYMIIMALSDKHCVDVITKVWNKKISEQERIN